LINIRNDGAFYTSSIINSSAQRVRAFIHRDDTRKRSFSSGYISDDFNEIADYDRFWSKLAGLHGGNNNTIIGDTRCATAVNGGDKGCD
jgi:hypothetical protein